jgi:hypothetical protein
MSGYRKCPICGKTGKRECPACGGLICARCCGAKRGSELPCPPSCPNFPFGREAYDLFLNVNLSWTEKTLRYVVDHVGRDTFEKALHHVDIGEENLEDAIQATMPLAVLYLLGYHHVDKGRTVADLWEEEGWAGLNNDERFMMKYRRRSFPTIVEARKVLSGNAIECADLLDAGGAPFVIFDRSLAWGTDRFSRYFIWVTHYPHFSRLEGSGLVVPENVYEGFLRLVRGRARGMNTRRAFLAKRYGDLCAVLRRLIAKRSDTMLKGMDLTHGRAEYAITGSREAVREILREKQDFDPDDRDPEPGDPDGTEYYAWLRRGESKKIEEEMGSFFRHDEKSPVVGSLGTLKLTPDRLIIEIFGERKYEFAKEMAEKYFGKEVRLDQESVEDLSEKLLEGLRERRENPSAHPPTPPPGEGERIPREVERGIIEEFYRDHYTKFLDDPVPALKGRTPRESAADPAMRPLLVELMKSHVKQVSAMCREKGIEMSIDWVLEELGLRELL